MPPHVTVVIPCYNQGHFLHEALRGVLAQTLMDWEAVVVDDGSTDHTREVASGTADARVRYQYQQNRGLSAARNAGIRSAGSRIIALLDSDDVWENTYLERMCGWLARHPDAAAAYCGFRYVDDQGREIGKPSLSVVSPDRFHHVLNTSGNWLIPSAVIFRMDMVEESEVFDETLGGLADLDLWLRLSERHSFVGLPEVLVRYRRHAESMSRNPELMVADHVRLTEKRYGGFGHRGPGFEVEKQRSFAYVHRYAAVLYLNCGDVQTSSLHVGRALQSSPEIRFEMGFWRALIRAHLPLESRGDPLTPETLSRSTRDILVLLDALAGLPEASRLGRLLPSARSRAFLALAEEGAQAGKWNHAAFWLRRAAAAAPTVVLSRTFWGTLARGVWRAARGGSRLAEAPGRAGPAPS